MSDLTVNLHNREGRVIDDARSKLIMDVALKCDAK